jgi:hypothetical protein
MESHVEDLPHVRQLLSRREVRRSADVGIATSPDQALIGRDSHRPTVRTDLDARILVPRWSKRTELVSEPPQRFGERTHSLNPWFVDVDNPSTRSFCDPNVHQTPCDAAAQASCIDVRDHLVLAQVLHVPVVSVVRIVRIVGPVTLPGKVKQISRWTESDGHGHPSSDGVERLPISVDRSSRVVHVAGVAMEASFDPRPPLACHLAQLVTAAAARACQRFARPLPRTLATGKRPRVAPHQLVATSQTSSPDRSTAAITRSGADHRTSHTRISTWGWSWTLIAPATTDIASWSSLAFFVAFQAATASRMLIRTGTTSATTRIGFVPDVREDEGYDSSDN